MKEAIGSGVRNCPNPCFRSVPLARDSLELGDSKPQIRDESNACIAGKSINSRAIQARLALMDQRVNFLSIHRRAARQTDSVSANPRSLGSESSGVSWSSKSSRSFTTRFWKQKKSLPLGSAWRERTGRGAGKGR